MSTDRRTMLGWFEYLDDAKRELTLSEFMAQMLFHLRQHAGKMSAESERVRNSSEHTEAMLGSFDELMHATNPDYRAIADRRARPVPPELPGG